MYKRNNSDTSKIVFQNIKKGIFQNPCQVIPVVEFVFNKVAGMDSRPAFVLKNVSTMDEFSWLVQSALTLTLVLVKVQDVHCRAALY